MVEAVVREFIVSGNGVLALNEQLQTSIGDQPLSRLSSGVTQQGVHVTADQHSILAPRSRASTPRRRAGAPGGRPPADKRHLLPAAAQAVLKDVKPDILLLQEVRDWDAAQRLCSVAPGLEVQVASRFRLLRSLCPTTVSC